MKKILFLHNTLELGGAEIMRLALLRNIDSLIAQSTGVPCFLADEPILCVAKGTGVVLENLDVYKRSVMSKRN